MDEMTPEFARLLESKNRRRQRLARLSFPEKVKAIVQLQQIAAPLLRRQGRQVRIWNLDD
jgi:hypothetical protein